ncbi:MAG: DNA topoisomerase VI subunit B [Saccharolobus sp.]|jgi:DNA topoisomerase-6 subunit B|uniref:DNA topoisomerase VI subunit B n=1 Tax=Saccharolobus sp. TaxID=2100761 RepID=UPI0028CF08C7|nr:DNA topoisomerase VI subunit B [Saccharolobus sp.]MDT7861074.1 DNA topoisomerase VI subunit B [Saccharolobus sp.]
MSAKEKFTSLSPAEFFKRNPELAGFPNPARALYQTVRELVENSLDATDVHGILPNIKIIIDLIDESRQIYKVNVTDNGIGIPPHEVPNAFGKVLYSSKYVNRQTRGMYGLGVKAAVLYSQMHQDRPVEIETSPINSKRIYSFKLKIDINKNEPIIVERKSVANNNGFHGTSVSIYIPGDWSKAKPRIYEYIRRTYIITPYAEFIFKDPEGNVTYYPRLTNKIPKPPQEVKPHPYGVDREEIKIMINNLKKDYILKEFLINEFQSIGETTAEKLLELSGLKGSKKVKSLSEEEITKLVEVLKKYEDFRAPSADSLSVIGEDLIELGLKKIFNPEFVAAVSRKPKAYQGHPFIVEAGIAYGGSIPVSEEPVVLRYANKIPLIYDEKSDVIWKVVEEIDWKRYGIESDQYQMVIMVHLCSTKIPYKSAGKESIAEVEDIEKEIKNTLMEVARKLKQYLSEKKKEEEAKKKLLTYLKYVPEVSRSFAVFLSNGSKELIFKYQSEIEDELFRIISKKLNLTDIEEYRKMYKVDSE